MRLAASIQDSSAARVCVFSEMCCYRLTLMPSHSVLGKPCLSGLAPDLSPIRPGPAYAQIKLKPTKLIFSTELLVIYFGPNTLPNADTILWSTSANGVQRSQHSSSFTTVSSLPAKAVIAADKQDNTVFYGGSSSIFYVSKDTGSTFSAAGALSGATSVRDIAAHPKTAGEVWVSTDVGIFRSTNYGASFTKVSTALTNTHKIALGLGSGSNWNVYAFGTGSAGARLYGSGDSGATWTDIQGSSQGFGAIDSCKLAGSGNTAGQVFVGTNGRGVLYASGSLSSGGGGSTTTTATTSQTTLSTTTTRVTTTTTTPTTTRTTSTSSTTTSPPSGTVPHYGQCGGIGYNGPTTCVSPYTCKSQNDYYSQCL
ncbi:hypothetical protein NUW58_g9475 [Xylaria curta]|uniref:Uncharacterized protein n=1 Tax=Xylaria curta TaxID=42375 RepID=A0ACC1MWM6_9PEZI|nr:hypothetical protein NUW58_g9475 [Xylaria curta]